jgi:hypothetical protein
MLKLVGNFKEMGYADQPDAPSLLELRGKRTQEHKTEVVTYLRKAKAISFSPGPLRDFFGASATVGSHTMRTDGVYVWPDFLAGYVARHDIELPEAFEQHMREQAWQLPASLDTSTLRVPWA